MADEYEIYLTEAVAAINAAAKTLVEVTEKLVAPVEALVEPGEDLDGKTPNMGLDID